MFVFTSAGLTFRENCNKTASVQQVETKISRQVQPACLAGGNVNAPTGVVARAVQRWWPMAMGPAGGAVAMSVDNWQGAVSPTSVVAAHAVLRATYCLPMLLVTPTW